ncbi:MAG: DUF1517 domain-containing protein [Anaerolineae bacterium]|nr:DUF1517 domain-containing protein [Gloeobacterales cyanobacterium ES-bin-313]
MAINLKSLLQRTFACGLALGLAVSAISVGEQLSGGDQAWARGSSGGRAGGGSFRSPSRSAPSRSGGSYGGGYAPGYGGGYGGGYGYGGGIGFFPIFLGGGGLGTIVLLVVVVGGAMYVLRNFRSDGADGGSSDKVDVFRLQVALLASAKQLQRDLNRIATAADTDTPAGLGRLNQEATLALLRNPEFWAYAKSNQINLPRLQAESQFNQLALAERTKYTEETLTKIGDGKQAIVKSFAADNPDEVAEYIVVTLLVATEAGVARLSDVRNAEELRQALATIGSFSGEQIVALEVIWTPQAENDTLTSEELLTQYTDLVRL